VLTYCIYMASSVLHAELPWYVDSATTKQTITLTNGLKREIRTYFPSKSDNFSVDTKIYKNNGTESLFIETAPIRLANKAQCAVDSKSPARSSTLFIDSYSLGQIASRMASATGQDQKSFINQAIERFRYTGTTAFKMIANRLLTGKLPLLPKVEKTRIKGDLFLKLSTDCAQTGKCKALDQYLSDIWSLGTSPDYFRISLEEWKLFDNFTKENFIKKSTRELNSHISCSFLKKFAPWKVDLLNRQKLPERKIEMGVEAHQKSENQWQLGDDGQMHLIKSTSESGSSSYNRKSDDPIVRALKERDDYIGSCDEIAAIEGLKAAAFQFDVVDVDPNYWNDVGFDFWNSLKIYLSYAMRNAPEINEMAFPVAYLVNSLNIEESLYLISNDCRSIAPPACNSDFLARESMRYLTDKDFAKTSTESDLLKDYSAGPSAVLLDKDLNVETDPMNYMKNPEYQKWGENFNSNLQRVRGYFKKRLSQAIRKSKLVTSAVSNTQIAESVRTLFNTVPESDTKRDSFFRLCGEFYLAGHPEFSFVAPNLAKYSTSTGLDPLMNHLGAMKFSEYYSYFKGVSDPIIKLCDELETTKYWEVPGYIAPSDNFRNWHRQMLKMNPPDETAVVRPIIPLSEKPFVAFRAYQTNQSLKNVICSDAVECARDILETMIALFATIHYRDYVATSLRETRSINANVVGSESVCGIYDPWWRTNKAFFDLGVDVVTGVIELFVTTPLYLDMTLAVPKVTSINELMDKGQLKYSPEFDKKTILASFGIDFGTLVGAPCVLSITNTDGPMFDTVAGNYLFTGLKLMACTGSDTQSVAVYSPAKTVQTANSDISGCFSCQLNFESISNEVSFLTNIPIVGGLYHLIKGVVRFFENILDPENVPQNYEFELNRVFEEYRVGEKMSSTSVKLYEYFTKKKNDTVWGYSEKGGNIFVYTLKCQRPLYLSTWDLRESYYNNKEIKILDGEDSCQWGTR